jgi:hypothetical protein
MIRLSGVMEKQFTMRDESVYLLPTSTKKGGA